MRSRSALTLAVAALGAGSLLASAPASAAPTNCQAPPGTSGIDQYCETIPGAGGDQGTRGGGSHHGHRVGNSVSRSTASALRRSAAGRAILGLGTGAPPGSGQGAGGASASGSGGGGSGSGGAGAVGAGKSGANGAASATGQGGVPAGRSDNPLQAVRSAVSTGTSAGPVFIWILAAVAAAIAGFAWLRYRRSSTS